MEATFLAQVLSFTSPVRIVAVTFFKLGEVRGREWPIFLCDARDVRARVKYPSVFSRIAFLKEDDVRLDALTVWRERPARQTQYGMHVAIVHQYLEHLARLAFE